MELRRCDKQSCSDGTRINYQYSLNILPMSLSRKYNVTTVNSRGFRGADIHFVNEQVLKCQFDSIDNSISQNLEL